jgi:hypothetical protein
MEYGFEGTFIDRPELPRATGTPLKAHFPTQIDCKESEAEARIPYPTSRRFPLATDFRYR